jgi:hypothetical protein
MKKHHSHKASRWDDFDPNDFAEQVFEDTQEKMRISQDLKRALAKTKSSKLKQLNKELDVLTFDRKEIRKLKFH